MSDEKNLPREQLTPAAVKQIKSIIEVFRKEFPDQCSGDELPQLVDQNDKEHDKALISMFGFLVQHLIKDDVMLQQAKKIPELQGLVITAEEFRANM